MGLSGNENAGTWTGWACNPGKWCHFLGFSFPNSKKAVSFAGGLPAGPPPNLGRKPDIPKLDPCLNPINTRQSTLFLLPFGMWQVLFLLSSSSGIKRNCPAYPPWAGLPLTLCFPLSLRNLSGTKVSSPGKVMLYHSMAAN